MLLTTNCTGAADLGVLFIRKWLDEVMCTRGYWDSNSPTIIISCQSSTSWNSDEQPNRYMGVFLHCPPEGLPRVCFAFKELAVKNEQLIAQQECPLYWLIKTKVPLYREESDIRSRQVRTCPFINNEFLCFHPAGSGHLFSFPAFLIAPFSSLGTVSSFFSEKQDSKACCKISMEATFLLYNQLYKRCILYIVYKCNSWH